MRKTTLQDLENFLKTIQKECPELKDTFFQSSMDGRRFIYALATKTEKALTTLTGFKTIPEMDAFLQGYYYKAINKY